MTGRARAIRDDETWDADELFDEIRRRCERLYPRMPRVLGLNRDGREDGAYVDDHSTGGMKLLLPLPSTHGERAALARLVLVYAAHDDRDENRITRHPKHPACLDLYLG